MLKAIELMILQTARGLHQILPLARIVVILGLTVMIINKIKSQQKKMIKKIWKMKENFAKKIIPRYADLICQNVVRKRDRTPYTRYQLGKLGYL